MRELLDTSSQRIMKILEILIFQDDWITISRLSDAIGASDRTAAHDIAILKKRWGQCLNIESSIKNGVKVKNRSIATAGSVFLDLFNESIALKWLVEIFFSPGKTIEDYEKNLFTSRSTLIRHFSKINIFLAKRGMSVQCKNNRYQILAENEQYLRQFFAGFLIEMKGLKLSKYNVNINWSIIFGILEKILSKNLNPEEMQLASTDEIAKMFHSMFYFISLVRESQGYTIASNHAVTGEITAEAFDVLRSYFPTIEMKNLCPIHEFIIVQYNGWDTPEEKAQILRETALFYDRLFAVTKIQPDENTRRNLHRILTSFYMNRKYRPYNTSALFDRISYFSFLYKKYNFFTYHLVENSLNIFSKKIGKDMSSKLPDIIFWTCLVYPEFNDFKPTKNILVITDFGIQHANFLAKVIASFFNNNSKKLQIESARLFDLTGGFSTAKYDIILTTIPNLPISHKKIILINDYPTQENLCEIYEALSVS